MDTKKEKKRILVVEDDLFLRDILSQKLKGCGFGFEGAIDSEDAFRILKSGKKIDLILLDLLLPGIGGQEILKIIKENPDWKAIPVIIASNLDSPEEKKNCKELGAADYMLKAQFTPDEIIKRIGGVLKQVQETAA